MSRILFATVVLLLMIPCQLTAQFRRAQQRTGSPPVFFALSDGEPISYYLEIAREIQLSEQQRVRLIEIRRLLRLQNSRFMRRLETLRDLAGIDVSDKRKFTEKDAIAIQRFNAWSLVTRDSIRQNNEIAHRETYQVLTISQRQRADSIARWVLADETTDGQRSRETARQRNR